LERERSTFIVDRRGVGASNRETAPVELKLDRYKPKRPR